MPLTVVEPVTARFVEVAPLSEVAPKTVRLPLALSAPPTFKSDASVVEPVTANVPLEVALLNVAPPLKASNVVVALFGKGACGSEVAVR